MKKVLILLAAVAAILTYAVFQIDQEKTTTAGMTKYSSAEFGLEFSYKTGPKGYVLEERIPADIGDYLRTLILYRTEDKANIDKGNIPVGGEGPATITVSVFKNAKKQQAGNWAEENQQYSNINLKTGEVMEAVVGGANAIRYMADGLYASDNVVVAHGENIYVFNGQYMDAESDLKKDFSPIIESVRFIPQPGQE